MATPTWFSSRPSELLAEDELRERLEYDEIKLAMLEMDVANAKLRIRSTKCCLSACASCES